MPEYKKHTKTNEDISKDRGATSEGLLLIDLLYASTFQGDREVNKSCSLTSASFRHHILRLPIQHCQEVNTFIDLIFFLGCNRLQIRREPPPGS